MGIIQIIIRIIKKLTWSVTIILAFLPILLVLAYRDGATPPTRSTLTELQKVSIIDISTFLAKKEIGAFSLLRTHEKNSRTFTGKSSDGLQTIEIWEQNGIVDFIAIQSTLSTSTIKNTTSLSRMLAIATLMANNDREMEPWIVSQFTPALYWISISKPYENTARFGTLQYHFKGLISPYPTFVLQLHY